MMTNLDRIYTWSAYGIPHKYETTVMSESTRSPTEQSWEELWLTGTRSRGSLIKTKKLINKYCDISTYQLPPHHILLFLVLSHSMSTYYPIIPCAIYPIPSQPIPSYYALHLAIQSLMLSLSFILSHPIPSHSILFHWEDTINITWSSHTTPVSWHFQSTWFYNRIIDY